MNNHNSDKRTKDKIHKIMRPPITDKDIDRYNIKTEYLDLKNAINSVK